MSSSHKGSQAIFDPADFYAFASWLFHTKPAASSQALRRTIIGRAYYAALICARDATGSSTSGANGHKNVVDALRKQDLAAGSKLDSLRLARQKADYENPSVTSRDVEISLKAAQIVLEAVGKSTPGIQSYSSDYLDASHFLSATSPGKS